MILKLMGIIYLALPLVIRTPRGTERYLHPHLTTQNFNYNLGRNALEH